MTDLRQAAQQALEALIDAANVLSAPMFADAVDALRTALEQPAQQEPEFLHCVDQPYDWSEWVCPDPKSYLFKCCDCGLVHEAEFGVVRYKSETEREECDMVNDPNLQAVFRMRRSQQWSPEDTAHRAGGLTMEQLAQQEPVAWEQFYPEMGKPKLAYLSPTESTENACYTTPQPAQRTWVGLTDEEVMVIAFNFDVPSLVLRTVEAKLKEKNT